MIWHSYANLQTKMKKTLENKIDWANFSFWAGRELFELYSPWLSYLYDSHKSLFSSTLNSLQELKQDAVMDNKDFFAGVWATCTGQVWPPTWIRSSTQVIKGFISSRNCPWLKTHSCRKTNCQCREKNQSLRSIEFTSAQLSREVQCWSWLWIFIFSKNLHDCETSYTIPTSSLCPLALVS